MSANQPSRTIGEMPDQDADDAYLVARRDTLTDLLAAAPPHRLVPRKKTSGNTPWRTVAPTTAPGAPAADPLQQQTSTDRGPSGLHRPHQETSRTPLEALPATPPLPS